MKCIRDGMTLITLLAAIPALGGTDQPKSLFSAAGQIATSGNTQLSGNLGDVFVGPSTDGATGIWSGFWGTLTSYPLAVDDPPRATLTFYLGRAQPNPSRNSSRIEFGVPHESSASLEIYDLLGRPVRQWRWAKLSAGPHQVSWDGRTVDGRTIPSGVLFYRLSVYEHTLIGKLIHLQ